MPKDKAGLQKKISAIFNGVAIPEGDDAQQMPCTPTQEHTEAPAKTAAPSHLTPTAPKPQQPAQSPPKATPAKQPKADATIKTQKTPRQAPWQQTLEKIKNKLLAPKPGVNPARQKAMVILVPVLFVVMILVLIPVFSPSSGKATQQTFEPSNIVAGSGNKIDWQIPEPYPTTLRDPMQFGPVTTTQDGTGNLIVKGIVYSEDNPSAVIGSQIVHEGEKISGVTIVKINTNSIEFEMDGKRWTQKVQQ